MAAIVIGLQFILGKIVASLAWIGALTVAAFAAFSDLGKDLLSWVFEQVLTVIIAALSGVADSSFVASLAAAAPAINSVPSQMVHMLALLGFTQAFGIIFAALSIRFMLGLIPFVRIGG